MNKHKVKVAILDEKISNDIIKEKIQKLLLGNIDFQIFECEFEQFYPSSDQMTMRLALKNEDIDVIVVGFHYLNDPSSTPNINFVKKQISNKEQKAFFQESPDWLSFNENISNILYEIRGAIEEEFLSEENIHSSEALEDGGDLPPMENIEEKEEKSTNDISIEEETKEEDINATIHAEEDVPLEEAEENPSLEDFKTEDRDLDIIKIDEQIYNESAVFVADDFESLEREENAESDAEDPIDDFESGLNAIFEATEEQNEDENTELKTEQMSDSKKERLFDIFKNEKKEKTYQAESPLVRQELKLESEEKKVEVRLSNEEIIRKLNPISEEEYKNSNYENIPLLYNQEPIEDTDDIEEDEGNLPPMESIDEIDLNTKKDKPRKEKISKEEKPKKLSIPKLPKISLPEKNTESNKKAETKKQKPKNISAGAVLDNIDIGFIGNLSGVGTSFIALELTKYLSSQEHKVCFIDMKNEIYSILLEQEYPFEIYNQDNYRDAYKEKGIRIFDFGVLDLNNKKELINFERCQKKFVVGNMSSLKGFGYNKNFEYAEEVEFFSILNFSNNTEKMAKKELKGLNIIPFPFMEYENNIPASILDAIK